MPRSRSDSLLLPDCGLDWEGMCGGMASSTFELLGGLRLRIGPGAAAGPFLA